MKEYFRILTNNIQRLTQNIWNLIKSKIMDINTPFSTFNIRDIKELMKLSSKKNKKKYFRISFGDELRAIQITKAFGVSKKMAINTSAPFLNYWYQNGSKFYTCLNNYENLILSQEFKDLYETEGWTGLRFSGPINIHYLKPFMVQKMDYYKVDFVGRCNKIKAHKLNLKADVSYMTNWEVKNDNGFDFFSSNKMRFECCTEEVMNKILANNLTNIVFEDLKTYRDIRTHLISTDKMEI